jgi:hypothetical protein
MSGAPLIVVAQLLRIVGYAMQLARLNDLGGITPFQLFGLSIVVEIFGFLDLSYRVTSSAARVVARLIALLPIVGIAIAVATRSTTTSLESGAWAYAAYSALCIACLWLASRRHVISAIAAALVVLTQVVPRFDDRMLQAIFTSTGMIGILALVAGPTVLQAVLALLIGRDLPALRIDAERIGRTLRRSWLALALLAIAAVVELAGGDPLLVVAICVFANLALVAIGYRTRTRSPGALAACIAPMFGFVVDAAATTMPSLHDTAAVPVLLVATLFVAPFALVAAHAKLRYAIAIAVLAVAAMVLGLNADPTFAARSTATIDRVLVGAFALVSWLIATIALRAAGRAIELRPPAPTVAEVFA